MRKIISIMLVLLFVAAMTISAYAATPSFGVPNLPEIPNISGSVKVDVTPAVNSWLDEHPFKIDWSMIDWSKWF